MKNRLLMEAAKNSSISASILKERGKEVIQTKANADIIFDFVVRDIQLDWKAK